MIKYNKAYDITIIIMIRRIIKIIMAIIIMIKTIIK